MKEYKSTIKFLEGCFVLFCILVTVTIYLFKIEVDVHKDVVGPLIAGQVVYVLLLFAWKPRKGFRWDVGDYGIDIFVKDEKVKSIKWSNIKRIILAQSGITVYSDKGRNAILLISKKDSDKMKELVKMYAPALFR